MKAADVIAQKGPEVITIDRQATVQQAITRLVEHKVGALVVVDAQGGIVGMLTERDILRLSARSFDRLAGVRVQEVMTDEVIIGLWDDELDYLMRLMTDQRVRHLPVMKDQKLAGLLSIGDLVKARSSWAELEIHYLRDYIAGQYPA